MHGRAANGKRRIIGAALALAGILAMPQPASVVNLAGCRLFEIDGAALATVPPRIDQVGHLEYVRPMPRRATPSIVNVAEAKARLPELIERAAQGEEIVLARNGKPRARLVPLERRTRTLRTPGKGKGRFTMRRDFDAALPDDVLALFDGRRT
jgi:prevent-host-death family protein